jgi:hypothetical protein
MPSTELMSTASLRTLMANSPLITPHGPPVVAHDCGGARNVTAPVARAWRKGSRAGRLNDESHDGVAHLTHRRRRPGCDLAANVTSALGVGIR